jgi:hypothetical protein
MLGHPSFQFLFPVWGNGSPNVVWLFSKLVDPVAECSFLWEVVLKIACSKQRKHFWFGENRDFSSLSQSSESLYFLGLDCFVAKCLRITKMSPVPPKHYGPELQSYWCSKFIWLLQWSLYTLVRGKKNGYCDDVYIVIISLLLWL